MPDETTPSRQLEQLRREWPRTTRQLESTYYQDTDWGRTYRGTCNDAGYCLWGLHRFAASARALLPGPRYTQDELDLAAAREVAYHWHKGSQFRTVPGALTTCWFHLVTERPIRLDQARKILHGHTGAQPRTTQLFSTPRSTEIPSSSAGWTHTRSAPVPIACVLPDLTPPNSDPFHSQGRRLPRNTSPHCAAPANSPSGPHSLGLTDTAAS
jgi:hypothetical protein